MAGPISLSPNSSEIRSSDKKALLHLEWESLGDNRIGNVYVSVSHASATTPGKSLHLIFSQKLLENGLKLTRVLRCKEDSPAKSALFV